LRVKKAALTFWLAGKIKIHSRGRVSGKFYPGADILHSLKYPFTHQSQLEIRN